MCEFIKTQISVNLALLQHFAKKSLVSSKVHIVAGEAKVLNYYFLSEIKYLCIMTRDFISILNIATL